MAHGVRALVDKLDALDLILGTHLMRERTDFLLSLQIDCGTPPNK